MSYRLLNDQSGLAKANGNVANTYKALGDFDSAYDHAVVHLKLAREMNDKVCWVDFDLLFSVPLPSLPPLLFTLFKQKHTEIDFCGFLKSIMGSAELAKSRMTQYKRT